MTTHPFDGHRVYDGCPDDTLQAKINAEEALLLKVKELHPGAHVTYFPIEGQWMVNQFGVPLSSMWSTKSGALKEVLGRNAND